MSDISPHIQLIKLIIAYTLVGALVFTVVVTCLSMVGWIKFVERGQQRKLFAVLVVQIVTLGIGVFANLLELSPGRVQRKVEAPLKNDVVQARGATNNAIAKLNREVLSGLTTETAQKAIELIQRAKEQGIEIRVIGGFRSPEQQRDLYARGRTTPGPRVTGTLCTTHATGQAFDIGVFENGKFITNSDKYEAVSAIGRDIGLRQVSGPLRDQTHFEMPGARAALYEIEGCNPAENNP